MGGGKGRRRGLFGGEASLPPLLELPPEEREESDVEEQVVDGGRDEGSEVLESHEDSVYVLGELRALPEEEVAQEAEDSFNGLECAGDVVKGGLGGGR